MMNTQNNLHLILDDNHPMDWMRENLKNELMAGKASNLEHEYAITFSIRKSTFDCE